MKKVIHNKLISTPAISSTNKTKVLSSHKPYYIQWRDAFTETDEWHSSETLTDCDYICETVGFLIEDNNSKNNYISIAGTITVDGNFASIINIPKAMIITKKLLTI